MSTHSFWFKGVIAMRQPLIIKVGGALLESIEAQNQLFGVIAQIKQQGVSIVLVHGAVA